MVAVTPFVGRSEELGALLAAVARIAGEGRPVAAMVVGDPGCGKSRLLAEVVARVGVETKLRVRGYEPEREVPFAGASDLLRALGQGQGTEARRLRSLLYERSTHDSGLEPLRVLEAAHRCLRETAYAPVTRPGAATPPSRRGARDVRGAGRPGGRLGWRDMKRACGAPGRRPS